MENQSRNMKQQSPVGRLQESIRNPFGAGDIYYAELVRADDLAEVLKLLPEFVKAIASLHNQFHVSDNEGTDCLVCEILTSLKKLGVRP